MATTPADKGITGARLDAAIWWMDSQIVDLETQIKNIEIERDVLMERVAIARNARTELLEVRGF